jgi:hypothetical protein
MLKQWKLNHNTLKKYGCYFMSLLYARDKNLLKSEESLVNLYDTYTQSGALGKNCLVLKPQEMVR